MGRAFCITAVSGRSQIVDDDHPLKGADGVVIKSPDGKPLTWWEMRPYTVQIPYNDYAELKKWIIIQCKSNNGQCDSQISSWDRTLENLDKAIIQK